MAKRVSKHTRPPRPLTTGAFARLDVKTDGEWMVQAMNADSAVKAYTCPGCNRRITVGAAHLVTWPREASLWVAAPVDERRHWHSACWSRRS